MPKPRSARETKSTTFADRDGLSDKIIGAEGGLQHVIERAMQVTRSDVPVLILGETGSGKEVIARAIHSHSPRAGQEFVRVNCGAIPPDLLDSELFGHERGAFTGASAQRRGWFEQADRGTLFLDEVGELPLAAQVRLLRILQDGTFTRVGGERSQSVSVRVVAATHRDLASMVKAGRFREDLWYRLAVFPIYLPPLREHREDIPPMAEHFARRAAERFGVAIRLPTQNDLVLLMAYDWPGNVRELGAVLDRAVLLGDGKRLEIAKAIGHVDSALSPAERVSPPLPARAPATSANPPKEFVPVPLNEVIREHIENTLRHTFGRVDGPFGAAKALGLNAHTLRGKMRKLNIDWRDFRNA